MKLSLQVYMIGVYYLVYRFMNYMYLRTVTFCCTKNIKVMLVLLLLGHICVMRIHFQLQFIGAIL